MSLKPDDQATDEMLLHPDHPTEETENDSWVVSARGVSKRFSIYKNDRGRMFEFFGRRTHHREHWALKNVDFQVERGRSFGIIGPNGAGKSTLLKLIGGITRPTEGEIRVRAQLSTLLDLGLGFHQNFSGRENIRLNCALLGMSPAQIEERIPAIINFAELGEFIDYPIRTYSAGMNLRRASPSRRTPMRTSSSMRCWRHQYLCGGASTRSRVPGRGKTIILVSHDLHLSAVCATKCSGSRRVKSEPSPPQVVECYVDIERERSAGAEARKVRPS